MSSDTKVDLVEQVTLKPTSYVYNLRGPVYKSAAGKKVDSLYSWKQNPSPMVYSAGTGLVMYDRIITNQQETELVNKLAKPKGPVIPVSSAAPQPAAKTVKHAAPPASSTETASKPQHTSLFKPRQKKYAPKEPEDPDQKYFRQERATMTAPQVFTWGNRFKYELPSGSGSSRTSVSLAHKPPLRL